MTPPTKNTPLGLHGSVVYCPGVPWHCLCVRYTAMEANPMTKCCKQAWIRYVDTRHMPWSCRTCNPRATIIHFGTASTKTICMNADPLENPVQSERSFPQVHPGPPTPRTHLLPCLRPDVLPHSHSIRCQYCPLPPALALLSNLLGTPRTPGSLPSSLHGWVAVHQDRL